MEREETHYIKNIKMIKNKSLGTDFTFQLKALLRGSLVIYSLKEPHVQKQIPYIINQIPYIIN